MFSFLFFDSFNEITIKFKKNTNMESISCVKLYILLLIIPCEVLHKTWTNIDRRISLCNPYITKYVILYK